MMPTWHPWRIVMSTSTFAVLQPKRRALDPGALRPSVESYLNHLVSQGYRESTLGHLGYIAKHFCYWLNHANIAVAEVNDGVVREFAAHRCKCPGNRASQTISAASVSGARKFISFLERAQVIDRPAPPLSDDRLHAYADWLRQHRGSSETTISEYRDVMNQLLPRLGPDPRKYDAALVRGVIMAESQRRSSVHMKRYVTTLRSYLRFLITQGQCAPTLDQAVPGVRHSTYSNIPKFLPATAVEKLINSCDTATPGGIRDRAVLLLLARLGLRAGDIVKLRIDDIDWQHGTLRVCGKERREATLPLPQDAGDALLRYLTEARPDAPFDQVFLHSKAPRQPFCRWTTVGKIVRRALVRAGIDDAPAHGAHLLRHSAATMLLQVGAPLATIGTVLRHRSVRTTAHYARVDFRALKQIAQPWPGGASC
jgi:integrase/recombinase XerD